MKKYFLLLFTSITLSAFSQNKDNIMAIYPGCENIKDDKNLAIKCFNDEFSKDLIEIVQQTLDTSNYNDFEVESYIPLKITEEGKIINNGVNSTNTFFNELINKSIVKLIKNLEQEGKEIKPAISKEGKRIAIVFNIPIRISTK